MWPGEVVCVWGGGAPGVTVLHGATSLTPPCCQFRVHRFTGLAASTWPC
jgi:hypothetical protein